MKEVVKTMCTEKITVNDIDNFNIYAFKGHKTVYKAHRVGNSQYAFLDLATSEFYANDVHSTLANLIKYTLNKGIAVYEFESVSDFAEWVLYEVGENDDEAV
jgi:hypothetical protein